MNLVETARSIMIHALAPPPRDKENRFFSIRFLDTISTLRRRDIINAGARDSRAWKCLAQRPPLLDEQTRVGLNGTRVPCRR